MDTITTNSKGKQFVEVEEEFVLEDTSRTRTVFKASMHPGGIRGDIIRFRKSASGICEELIPIKFNSLHENDGIKITLPTEATRTLYEKLKELEALLEEQGIHYGRRDYTVVDLDALVNNDSNKASIIRKLLETDSGEEVWRQLVDYDHEVATRLAISTIQNNRISVLRKFEQMLANKDLSENEWQIFFEKNTWIFGYGLRYQILHIIQSQPNYGGSNITGSGGQRGDFLTNTEAVSKYTCLVEIKKPTANLLQNTQYRNGAWGISNELAEAVSQIQVNCAQWEIYDSRFEQNRERLSNTITVSPKGIVVIGNTSELNCWNKQNSFERFRREIRNPEIITYDELYERTRFIVEGSNPISYK